MATVIYLPKGGKSDFGDALGSALSGITTGKIAESKNQERSQQLSQLFEGLQTGGQSGQNQATKSIASGAISDPTDIIRLVSTLRQREQESKGNLVKVPAFDQKGQPTAYASTLEKVQSGQAELEANERGLTLSGKKKTGGTPTDKQIGISDYLGSKNLESNQKNRTNARQFLYNRHKASDIINSQFGKKFGNDWVIEPGVKQQMAAHAEDLIEDLIVNEGLSAQQAGTEATRRSRLEFEDLTTDRTPEIKQEGEGWLETIRKMLSGTGAERVAEQSTTPDNTSEIEPLGTLNGVEVGIPKDSTMSPAQAMDYIKKTYDVSEEDARAFVLGLEP